MSQEKINTDGLIVQGIGKAYKNKTILHDVDLLPSDELGEWYASYPDKPIHIAKCWNRYNKDAKYFGGIVSISANDMMKINGFPNTFWGWGGEDEAMRNRCEKEHIIFDNRKCPANAIITDLEGLNLEDKLKTLKKIKK